MILDIVAAVLGGDAADRAPVILVAPIEDEAFGLGRGVRGGIGLDEDEVQIMHTLNPCGWGELLVRPVVDDGRRSRVPELPAEFGGFALEVVERGVVLASEPGVHGLDEVAEADLVGGLVGHGSSPYL